MADEAAPTTEAPEQVDAAATAEQTEPQGDDLGDAGKKALAAERSAKRAAEKQLSELTKRLQEFEDRDKTEAQKLSEKYEAAEQRATAAEQRALRLQVISETGLPANLHKFVVGANEGELRENAAELMAQFSAEKRSVDVGLGPRSTGPTHDMNDIFRKATGRA